MGYERLVSNGRGNFVFFGRFFAFSSFYTGYTGAFTWLTLAPHCGFIRIEEPVLCTELLPEEGAGNFCDAYAILNATALKTAAVHPESCLDTVRKRTSAPG